MEQLKDKWLVCSECGRRFLWDAGEQYWFSAMGFSNMPKRCHVCRSHKRGEEHHQSRQRLIMRCERCGAQTIVPFVPTGSKPVYCRKCMPRGQT